MGTRNFVVPAAYSGEDTAYLQHKGIIESAREIFYRNPVARITEIRPEVLASWQRSWDYGINPERVEKIVLPRVELDKRIENNRNLYDTSVPLLEDMYNFVKGSGFMCMLSDNEGYVLKIIGDEEVIEAAQVNQLIEGANRSERTFGTCGIGTCIYLQRPVQIWAGEHYYRRNNTWSGSAAPVFDDKKQMVGVLCLCGFWDCVNFHTLGLVASAAKAASRQLQLENTRISIDNTHHKLDQVIEILNYGIVFTNIDGVILQINSPAARLLNPGLDDKRSLVGGNIRDYLSGDIQAAALRGTRPERTLVMDSASGQLQCTIAFVPDTTRDECGELILTLRRPEHKAARPARIPAGSEAKFIWDDLVGQSSVMEEAKRLAKLAAPYPSNVLLNGASGVGKEVFAQAIHNASNRAHAPFVAINCGALPRSLIESELFGYEGGAFTGSKREGHPGKFELANGGTVFLDEIGDMPLDVQVLLLRVLQTREVVRIGSRAAIPVDVRVISATNKDLTVCVRNGTFREDLYYRLNVFAIRIPPLKERTGDIRLLADHMLGKFAAKLQKHIRGLSEEAYRLLERHDWPGNLRELENAVERAVLVCQGDCLRPDDLPSEIRCAEAAEPETGDRPDRAEEQAGTAAAEEEPKAAAVYEEDMIRKALLHHNGNIRKISAELGLGRTTLYRKLKKYGIDVMAIRNG